MANNLTREEHLTALANAIKTYADSRIATVGGGASYTLPTASATQKGGIIPGAGLSMAGDTLNVTIGGGETYSEATTLTAGLMPATDKAKLDALDNYTLPTASTSTKGGIKVGTGLAMNGDTLNCTITGGSGGSGSSGGSVTELVLPNTASTVNGAVWIEGTTTTSTASFVMPVGLPTNIYNGSMWLVP